VPEKDAQEQRRSFVPDKERQETRRKTSRKEREREKERERKRRVRLSSFTYSAFYFFGVHNGRIADVLRSCRGQALSKKRATW
jgi:hypothetical protein